MKRRAVLACALICWSEHIPKRKMVRPFYRNISPGFSWKMSLKANPERARKGNHAKETGERGVFYPAHYDHWPVADPLWTCHHQWPGHDASPDLPQRTTGNLSARQFA